MAVAAIRDTLFTCATAPTINNRLYRDPVARLVIVHTLSYLFNDSAKFMAKCQWNRLSRDWMRRRRTQVGATQILMKVYARQY